jgi:hypothetical protein
MTKLAVVATTFILLASCHQSPPQIVFKHGVTRGRLQKNGLRFVITPDPTTELVEVDLRYEVGSREDPWEGGTRPPRRAPDARAATPARRPSR